jgi:hypothetical protein
MFSPPGTTQSVACEITDLVTGAVATGTVTAHLPAITTALIPRVIHSVGGTSSVIGLCLFSLYVEADARSICHVWKIPLGWVDEACDVS